MSEGVLSIQNLHRWEGPSLGPGAEPAQTQESWTGPLWLWLKLLLLRVQGAPLPIVTVCPAPRLPLEPGTVLCLCCAQMM